MWKIAASHGEKGRDAGLRRERVVTSIVRRMVSPVIANGKQVAFRVGEKGKLRFIGKPLGILRDGADMRGEREQVLACGGQGCAKLPRRSIGGKVTGGCIREACKVSLKSLSKRGGILDGKRGGFILESRLRQRAQSGELGQHPRHVIAQEGEDGFDAPLRLGNPPSILE